MGNGVNNTAKKENKGFWARLAKGTSADHLKSVCKCLNIRFGAWLAKGTSAEPWLTAEQIVKDPAFKKQQDEIKKIKKIIQNRKTISE